MNSMRLKLRWMYSIFEWIEEVKTKKYERLPVAPEVENQEYFAWIQYTVKTIWQRDPASVIVLL